MTYGRIGAREEEEPTSLEKYIRTVAKYFDIGRSGKLISRARCTTPVGNVIPSDKVRWKNYCRCRRDDDRRQRNNFCVFSFPWKRADVENIRSDSGIATVYGVRLRAPYTHEFSEPQSIRSRDCFSDCFGLEGGKEAEWREERALYGHEG